MRIALIVGHNEDAPGACSPYLDVCEYEFNQRVADDLAHLLMTKTTHDATIFFRDGEFEDVGDELRDVSRRVNTWGADICFSLHFNSAESAQATGSEVLYWHTSLKGQSLAEGMLKAMKRNLNLKRRALLPIDPVDDDGVWDDRGQILRMTAMPHVLLEPFFGSNETDCQRIAEIGAEGVAKAYYDGITAYAGGAVEEEPSDREGGIALIERGLAKLKAAR